MGMLNQEEVIHYFPCFVHRDLIELQVSLVVRKHLCVAVVA